MLKEQTDCNLCPQTARPPPAPTPPASLPCGKNQGWNFRQNYLYTEYLLHNKAIFKYEQMRKRLKVFSSMAGLITTRSPVQIKTHHHKMLNRHKTVSSIIEHFQGKLAEIIHQQPELTAVREALDRRAKRFFEEETDKRGEFKMVEKSQPVRSSPRGRKMRDNDTSRSEVKAEEGEEGSQRLTAENQEIQTERILCEQQVSYIINDPGND